MFVTDRYIVVHAGNRKGFVDGLKKEIFLFSRNIKKILYCNSASQIVKPHL
jgi:hypothetical protein